MFAQIVLANPTNELGARAESELGDCYLQLGAFDAATNAYAQVMNSPYAGVPNCAARRKSVWGGRWKKAGPRPRRSRKRLLQQALDNYLDVFDTWTETGWPAMSGRIRSG